jgi:hypothetical protein
MRTLRALPIVAVAALAVACESSTAVTDGVLTVTHTVGVLHLRNGSPTPVYYFVLERETAALVDWIPLVGPESPTIPARGEVALPYSAIFGYAAGAKEALVYWWRAVPDGAGGYRADSVRNLVAQF